MTHSKFNRVRSLRLGNAMKANDLAGLVGLRSGTAISHFETGDRVPSLKVALALQVVFGLKPDEMFPGLFSDVEDRVMARARHLYEALEGKTGKRVELRRALFEEMARRDSSDVGP